MTFVNYYCFWIVLCGRSLHGDRETFCLSWSTPRRKNTTQKIQFSPCFTPTVPIAFEKDDIIDLKFMDPKARVFRLMPTLGKKEYLAWIDRVQNKRQA